MYDVMVIIVEDWQDIKQKFHGWVILPPPEQNIWIIIKSFMSWHHMRTFPDGIDQSGSVVVMKWDNFILVGDVMKLLCNKLCCWSKFRSIREAMWK